MAWPAFYWTHQEALNKVNDSIVKAYYNSVRLSQQSQDGNTYRGHYVNLYTLLSEYLGVLNRARQIPGIAQYAQNQLEQFVGLDAAAEFLAVGNAMLDLRNWIMNQLQNEPEKQIFTPEETLPFRNQVTIFISNIDMVQS